MDSSPDLTTPGDILRKDFMEPLQVSPERLARDLDVSERTLGQILAGRRRISRTMAHRLHMRFKTSTDFWLNAQSRYDLGRLARWEQIAGISLPRSNRELH